MDRHEDYRRIFSTTLPQSRDTPIRLAFATLVGSHRFWAAFVVGSPLVALLAALGHQLFVPLAAGVPVGVCLYLLWMSHEVIQPRLVVDTAGRTLTKSKPYDTGTYAPIDVDDLECVSVTPFDRAAFVSFEFERMAISKPHATAIATADVHTFARRLEEMGVDVRIREPTPSPMVVDPTRVRLIATPFVVVSTMVAVWRLFGLEAFLTNVVLVPAIVIVGFALYSFWRRHIRGLTDRSKR